MASGHPSTRTNRLLIASSHYIYYDLQTESGPLLDERKEEDQPGHRRKADSIAKSRRAQEATGRITTAGTGRMKLERKNKEYPVE